MGAPAQYGVTAFGWSTAILLVGLLSLSSGSALAWHTIVLEPAQDNTLYESEPDMPPTQNELSNGQGIFLFAGRTGMDAGFRLRRAALQFDLTPVPPGSEIFYAELILFQSRAAPGSPPSVMTLHRLREPWGEGASDAAGPEGQGAFAEPGDVTWFNRFYPVDAWESPGGDFVTSPSAQATLGDGSLDFTWMCNPLMVQDLNGWLAAPAQNHGWILLGFEDGAQNARRFHSREHVDAQTRPRLRLFYRAADELLIDGFEDQQGCLPGANIDR